MTTLKLTGIKTYTGPATKGAAIKKGEVCKFDDAVAEQIKLGSRVNGDGEPIPFFTKPDADDKVTRDFSTPAAAVAPATVNPSAVAEALSKSTQRRPRAA